MQKFHKYFSLAVLMAAISISFSIAQAQDAEHQTIVVDASAPAHSFPHFWEKMFGSGRAILSLRESYRDDLRAVKQITGFEYVRPDTGAERLAILGPRKFRGRQRRWRVQCSVHRTILSG